MSELLEIFALVEPSTWAFGLFLLHGAVQMVVAVRVVMTRRSVGASLAWITILFAMPVVGLFMYLMVGELRLGSRRARLVRELTEPTRNRYLAIDTPSNRVNWHEVGEHWQQLARCGQQLLQVPTLPGNHIELIGHWEDAFDQLLRDIDGAKVNCDFEFYIWQPEGRTEEIVAAIERACRRGVVCRILVDSLGSKQFLRSRSARALVSAGAIVQGALPGGIWRLPFIRFDLRMHRKIVLIDDQVAWTGSLNLVDPRFFKQKAGVGQWIDAMVRIEGPAVEALAITFQIDWYIETNSTSRVLPDISGQQKLHKVGNSAIQVLPSGPANRVEAIEKILISAIYAAREEIVITTPYFVPSEALQMALSTATHRGVKVIVILPTKVDSILVRLASSTFKEELALAGVLIAQFDGGLLHTKSVTIDKELSLFGSLNMDPRSFRLNFEITLVIFDPGFSCLLRALQQTYIDRSEIMDSSAAGQRSGLRRFGENVARLFSPLL